VKPRGLYHLGQVENEKVQEGVRREAQGVSKKKDDKRTQNSYNPNRRKNGESTGRFKGGSNRALDSLEKKVQRTNRKVGQGNESSYILQTIGQEYRSLPKEGGGQADEKRPRKTKGHSILDFREKKEGRTERQDAGEIITGSKP